MTESQAAYRQALTRFATGVALVTAESGDRQFAMTANALTSVSLEPVMLLVCFSRGSQTRSAALSSGRFGLSVLCGNVGAEVAERCARSAGELEHQLDGVALRSSSGPPLLEHCLAHAVCAVEEFIEVGERDALIGLVESIGVNEALDESPIVYYEGAYRRLAAGIEPKAAR